MNSFKPEVVTLGTIVSMTNGAVSGHNYEYLCGWPDYYWFVCG
jgi:hypothetical protein